MSDVFKQLGTVKNPGYHMRDIPKGGNGELSKVLEELLEAMDAEEQGSTIMLLIELSDMLGALENYLQENHPTITLNDLKIMSDITKRAFSSGRRS